MSPSTSISTHFKLCFLGAVRHVVDQLTNNLGSLDEVLEQFPFISGYLAEIEEVGPATLAEWERGIETHLPLRALRETLALDEASITLLFAIGLIEEDPRFGFLMECAQPVPSQQHRPTLGLLTAWWRDDDVPVRERIRALLDHGLIQVINADAPRLQWVFQTPPAVWDALRGEMPPLPAPWLTFTAADELPSRGDLVIPEALRRAVDSIPSLIESGDVRALIVRGPQHNGRRSIVRSIARALGYGVLELRGPLRVDDERWPLVTALATLAHAIPVLVLDLGLGDACELPPLHGFRVPFAVVMGRHGAVSGRAVEGAVTITVDMPGLEERRALWRNSIDDAGDADTLAERFRMTSGNIRSAAALARSYALIETRPRITPHDVRRANRVMHRELETLATFLPTSGGWESIGASIETLGELYGLESRCRHRERLPEHVGAALGRQLNCGVRALFAGPSGTGKTMAARLLASTLEMDLYRLDLASVVNKYIGETEKSLNQLFSRAEELDVVLLIDEGDALLTNRTNVQSANDRYANLETNFLLQRLETFEGVLIVTTNAVQRIDAAFQRRMDVVVEFRMPDPQERWMIWQLHLPVEHSIEHSWLHDAAVRCELTGGQIRNAVLHASLLALDNRRAVSTIDVDRALQREYRKSGAVCPMPQHAGAGA